MTTNKKLEKFTALVSDKPSGFLAELEYYTANRKRLDRSAKVAISLLDALKDKGWTQKDLAESMGVSPQHINKIIKGNGNLTFDTIDKLEAALGIELIDVLDYKSPNDIQTESESVKTQTTSVTEGFLINNEKPSEDIKPTMNVVYNINVKESHNEYLLAQ